MPAANIIVSPLIFAAVGLVVLAASSREISASHRYFRP